MLSFSWSFLTTKFKLKTTSKFNFIKFQNLGNSVQKVTHQNLIRTHFFLLVILT